VREWVVAMSELSKQPELAAPVLAPAAPAPVLGLSVLAAAALAAVAFMAMPMRQAAPSLVPTTYADLGEELVTPVDPSNAAAVAAAVSALRLPQAQRVAIERAVLERDRRIAWIVLTDSMDPDGDTVAVEAGGIVQHVVLTKAWMPVAIPLAGPGTIAITGVRDGGGGGITVALATRTGPVALRVLLPGERIEVAAP
jgi:hypothetical protein